MIRKVKFSNFYSFNGEQEISFLANKKKKYDYFQSISGDQIAKVSLFIGGNGSGKTNVMRLFSFLSYFITTAAVDNHGNILDGGFQTFFKSKKSSDFLIEFEKDKIIFYYYFSIKDNVISEENLSIKDFNNDSRKRNIFSRKSKIFKLNPEYFIDIPKNALNLVRPDISLIAYLKSNYNIEIINKVFDYFQISNSNINERGEINARYQQAEIAKLYLKDKKLKEDMEHFVSNFDLGLNGIEIIKNEDINKIQINGLHKLNKEKNKISFEYESRGTRSLFFILGYILDSLKNNSIVIIDEIETGFHPDALSKIIDYFIDENSDSSAQLIFSSHSLFFMNKLDMHQIYLVEKNDKNESNVHRLSQIKGIRSDDNFLTKYMAGAYGSFPKIRV
ncbi:MAG: ATP-binding protein [Candidatus Paceibacterota bacterium]|jgi:hypothetical protein